MEFAFLFTDVGTLYISTVPTGMCASKPSRSDCRPSMNSKRVSVSSLEWNFNNIIWLSCRFGIAESNANVTAAPSYQLSLTFSKRPVFTYIILYHDYKSSIIHTSTPFLQSECQQACISSSVLILMRRNIGDITNFDEVSFVIRCKSRSESV